MHGEIRAVLTNAPVYSEFTTYQGPSCRAAQMPHVYDFNSGQRCTAHYVTNIIPINWTLYYARFNILEDRRPSQTQAGYLQ